MKIEDCRRVLALAFILVAALGMKCDPAQSTQDPSGPTSTVSETVDVAYSIASGTEATSSALASGRAAVTTHFANVSVGIAWRGNSFAPPSLSTYYPGKAETCKQFYLDGSAYDSCGVSNIDQDYIARFRAEYSEPTVFPAPQRPQPQPRSHVWQ